MSLCKSNYLTTVFLIEILMLSCVFTVKLTKSNLKSSSTQTVLVREDQIFQNACENPSIVSNRMLQATCNGKNQSIDLNTCLVNSNGKLFYAQNGKFYNSCSKCFVVDSPNGKGAKAVSCKCADANDQIKSTSIDINSFVYFDSKIKCADLEFEAPDEDVKPEEVDLQCNNGIFQAGKNFQASCIRSDKKSEEALLSFDLDKCVSNMNGVLTFQKNGSFSKSCDKCEIKMKKNVYRISCKCKDAADKVMTANGPLNRFIQYKNNKLSCKGDIEIIKIEINAKFNSNLSASDNFMIACKNLEIDGNSKLKAKCGENNAQVSLDLNKCLANEAGRLIFKKDGKFSDSCRECRVEFDVTGSYNLVCGCFKNEAITIKSVVSLKEKIVIDFEKGALACLTELALPDDSAHFPCITPETQEVFFK